MESADQRADMKTFNLFLADRAYDASGQLIPRSKNGALIKDETEVLKRVRRVLEDKTIIAHDGEKLTIDVHSILVHSETPGAVKLAQTIVIEIKRVGGMVVRPVDTIVDDQDGICAFSPSLADKAIAKALKQHASEEATMQAIREERWDRSFVNALEACYMN